MEKTCRDCGQTKLVNEFYKAPPSWCSKDGLVPICKACWYAASRKREKTRQPRHPPPMGMKRCADCKEIKPTEAFYRCKSTYDGLAWSCSKCSNARRDAWREKNRAHVRESQKRRYRTNPDSGKDDQLRHKLGVPKGTYAKMFAAQEGKCAICKTDDPGKTTAKRPINDSGRRFALDHCRETLVWRGLLCNSCNRGLGCFSHDPDILMAAANYLKSPPCSGI